MMRRALTFLFLIAATSFYTPARAQLTEPDVEPIDLGPRGALELPAVPVEKSEAKPLEVEEKIEIPVTENPTPTPVPVAEAPTPTAPPNPQYGGHDVGDLSDEELEDLLQEPTRYPETYEEARVEKIARNNRPSWSLNLGVNPRAFSRVDLRFPAAPAGTAGASETVRPGILGIEVTADKMLTHRIGQLSIGGGLGVYASKRGGAFENTLPMAVSLSPHAIYELIFANGQMLVPTAAFHYEVLRYSYKFAGQANKDVKFIPRFELGGMLYLNFLEPSSAGNMRSNYGIKRTYLTAALSVAQDQDPTPLDFSERALKFGFRFEF